jgi:uncharacterized membrane protein (Fun14 family)
LFYLDLILSSYEKEVYSDLPLEDLLFSAGGGFLFGALAGYAI